MVVEIKKVKEVLFQEVETQELRIEFVYILFP